MKYEISGNKPYIYLKTNLPHYESRGIRVTTEVKLYFWRLLFVRAIQTVVYVKYCSTIQS